MFKEPYHLDYSKVSLLQLGIIVVLFIWIQFFRLTYRKPLNKAAKALAGYEIEYHPDEPHVRNFFALIRNIVDLRRKCSKQICTVFKDAFAEKFRRLLYACSRSKNYERELRLMGYIASHIETISDDEIKTALDKVFYERFESGISKIHLYQKDFLLKATLKEKTDLLAWVTKNATHDRFNNMCHVSVLLEDILINLEKEVTRYSDDFTVAKEAIENALRNTKKYLTLRDTLVKTSDLKKLEIIENNFREKCITKVA